MLSLDNFLNFHAKTVSLPLAVWKSQRAVEISNNFAIYHTWSNFHQQENLNKSISLWLECKSLIIKSTQVLVKRLAASGNLFSISLAFELKAAFVVRLVISRILFSISEDLVLRAALLAILLMPGILLSISTAFVVKPTLVAMLLISGVLFSISEAFVLKASLATKQVILISSFQPLQFLYFNQSPWPAHYC